MGSIPIARSVNTKGVGPQPHLHFSKLQFARNRKMEQLNSEQLVRGCIAFPTLPEENVTEIFVVATWMVMPKINIHPPRRRGLRGLMRAFWHSPSVTHLKCKPICIFTRQRVNISAVAYFLQSGLLADLWTDF